MLFILIENQSLVLKAPQKKKLFSYQNFLFKVMYLKIPINY